ncbi:MAG TPA: hypothetical protein PL196_11630 [Burkholderiaceae bacterium]|nr:hypothetical protein [Burkholderiaceae bacterium]
MAIFAAWLPAAPAAAEVVDIAWGDSGSFERSVDVAPGRFVEACTELRRGTAVRWRFEAGATLDFNVHYHEGSDVRYPVPNAPRREAEGRLVVPTDHAMCWMWTNRTPAPVRLDLRLVRS